MENGRNNEALHSLENKTIDISFLRAEARSEYPSVILLVREQLILALPKHHGLLKQTAIKLDQLTGVSMGFVEEKSARQLLAVSPG